MNYMAITLIQPNEEHRDEVEAYKAAFVVSGDTMAGCGALEKLTFDGWLERARDGMANPSWGKVPATQFMAVDQTDGNVIGMMQLRHTLNDALLESGGHIGYSVHPAHRGKGYATEMVRLCLDQAREMGIDKVLIVCDEDNAASARVIEKSGGVYEDTRPNPDKGGTPTKRYWITL
jgi:predicted acetyltransferase